jgi:hypothetical protein
MNSEVLAVRLLLRRYGVCSLGIVFAVWIVVHRVAGDDAPHAHVTVEAWERA